MTTRSGLGAGLALLFGAAAVPAAAQQVLPLPGGFSPDPWLAEIEASGLVAASDWVRGCPGHVSEAPALRIVLSEPEAQLRIVQAGEGLAGLVAAGPDGVYRCAAQGPSGRTALTLEPPLAGDWVLFPSLAAPGGPKAVQVLISERDLDEADLFRLSGAGAGPLMPSAPPAFGTHALAADGALSVPVVLSGTAPAGAVADPVCAGWIDPTRPDLVLRLEPGEPFLALRATGGADLTLVVVDPEGGLHCNDDAYGTDPALGFEAPAAGNWALWVGTFSTDGAEHAIVDLGRSLPDAGDADGPMALGLTAEPAAGRILLGADAATLALAIDPTAMASDAEPGCSGNIEPSRPDAVVTVPEGAPALWLRAEAPTDTTLLVVAPDGSLHCIDDGFGTDPVLEFAAPMAGDWRVWVGLWAAVGPEAVTLHAGPDPVSVGLPEAFTPGDSGAAAAPSPFLGRTIPDALTALDILLEDPAAAEALHYETREALGPEGFRLTGVTLHDPEGVSPPVSLASVTVEGLDLEGLAQTGAPGRFRFVVSGLDYAGIATALGDAQGVGLPELPPDATIGFELGLLPPEGDASRRVLSFGLDLEGHIGVLFTARVQWPEGPGMPEDTGALPAEAMRLEIANRGYVARMLDRQAADMGMTVPELVATLMQSLSEALAPVVPGSPAARLVEAVGQALAAPQGPGVLRMAVSTDNALGLEALLETLSTEGAAAAEAAGLRVDLGYEPQP